jgi:hypothetical protein
VFANRNGVFARPSIRVDVRRYDCAVKGLPVRIAHLGYILHAVVLEELIGINVLSDRLNLQEGNVASEFNGCIGLEKPDVVK